ncbi:MAG: hypothetical protein AAFQ66_22605 [Pseudomonadota bacterium]
MKTKFLIPLLSTLPLVLGLDGALTPANARAVSPWTLPPSQELAPIPVEGHYGGEDLSDDSEGSDARTIFASSLPLDLERTNLIIRMIEDASDRCDRVINIYQIDCVRSEYSRISKLLPSSGAYSDVQEAMADAARDLERLVRATRDRDQRRARVRLPARPTDPRNRNARLRPTSPQMLGRAQAQAAAIIDEARTQLIRAAANSDKRKTHFQKVAQAMNSSKVLLRS